MLIFKPRHLLTQKRIFMWCYQVKQQFPRRQLIFISQIAWLSGKWLQAGLVLILKQPALATYLHQEPFIPLSYLGTPSSYKWSYFIWWDSKSKEMSLLLLTQLSQVLFWHLILGKILTQKSFLTGLLGTGPPQRCISSKQEILKSCNLNVLVRDTFSLEVG